jgi:hypothetical protein
MGRKELKKLLESVLEVADRLSEVHDSLSPLEVSQHLRAAGTNVEKLRARLYATASELAKQQRLKGKPAPIYLQQVIDASGPSDKIPSNLKMALDITKRLIASLTEPFKSIPNLEVQRAYRKSGELSEADQQLLDAQEEELKKKIREAGEKSDG